MLYPFKIYVKAKTGNTDLCSWQLQGAEILIDFFGSENIKTESQNLNLSLAFLPFAEMQLQKLKVQGLT